MFKQTIMYKKAKKVAETKPLALFKVIFNTPMVRNWVVEMNTIEQLYNKGVDSTRTDLSTIGGNYSFVTKDFKSSKGVPYDHITLKDTGDFYKSWRVFIYEGNIVIEADTIKDGEDLQERWGDNILGLTDESKNKLIIYALEKYRKLWE